ncbi:MAG: phosphoesterase [Methanocorpusculum sp.]|uniref:DHH family phosphoesterase n=1 Tax=Methanocorpusculum sp. TaxID=2058474 RepID=UPI002718A8B2|nr:phosphoesterase [Methanocorpusculum sp.]MDO9522140.1 phosphoesterase [Methanocorpusculum sp.]
MVKSNNTKNGSNKQTLQEKIVGRTTNIVHLTHNDLDAAGSDAVCRMTFGNEILTLFSSVGKFTWFTAQVSGCNGKGDTLIISDLGYQNGIEDQIRKAHAAGWVIQWYDHHKWTDAEKHKVTPFVQTLIVDTTKCATGVVASVLAKDNQSAREVASVVCDYDLWKHQDPRSAKLGIVTSKQENLRLIRDKLTQGIIIDDEISSIFEKIEHDKNKCMKKSIRAAKIFRGKYTIAVMPAYGYPSETSAEARRQLGTDMELLVFDNGKFSLRSVPEISHLIAKQFGGGGHPNASGGSFNYTWKEKWMLKLFRKVSRADSFITAAQNL